MTTVTLSRMRVEDLKLSTKTQSGMELSEDGIL